MVFCTLSPGREQQINRPFKIHGQWVHGNKVQLNIPTAHLASGEKNTAAASSAIPPGTESGLSIPIQREDLPEKPFSKMRTIQKNATSTVGRGRVGTGNVGYAAALPTG